MRTNSSPLNRNILYILLLISATIIWFVVFINQLQTTSVMALNDPQLIIPSQIYAPPNSTVVVPIQFASNDNLISSIVFSIDYDETQLNFDPTVPFSITFNIPGQFSGSCSPDTSDVDGEIDCFILDPVAPLSALPDGTLVSITLRTLDPPTPSIAPVGFSQDSPSTSFGNTEGQSVPGSTIDGSVYIDTVPPTEFHWVYLPSLFKVLLKTPTPTPTPTPTQTPLPGCSEFIVNGGFESKTGWEIINTPYRAGYSQEKTRNGLWSMRTGIVKDGDNVYSYSSFQQDVTIPADAESALLKFWLYPRSGEGSLQVEAPMIPDSFQFLETPLANDLQYVIILDAGNNWIDTLVWQLKNSQTWTKEQFSLMKYAGKTIRLRFGTFNDGWDGVSSMYVDDVSLKICD